MKQIIVKYVPELSTHVFVRTSVLKPLKMRQERTHRGFSNDEWDALQRWGVIREPNAAWIKRQEDRCLNPLEYEDE